MDGGMKFLTVLFCMLALAGCGGSDDDSSETSPSKNLFSYWADENNSSVDLTGGDFNEPALFSFFLEDGAECACNFLLFGGQTTGSYVLNSCQPINNVNFQICESFNQTGTYAKTDFVLTITNSNGSFPYR